MNLADILFLGTTHCVLNLNLIGIIYRKDLTNFTAIFFNKERDTLGYYRGLSSPRQFTYFQTKPNTDSIIDLEFSVGINHFSEFLAEQSEDYINSFNEKFEDRIEFKPVRLDLKTDLKKKMEIELINRKN